MRRRLVVALLAAGLLLAGFTAAAVASGGSPFGLLEDQPSAAADPTASRDALDRTTTDVTTSAESTEVEPAEEESESQEKTTTEVTSASHNVTICHHTGSKKHPSHPISVDEHALPAHTRHGDTVGPCPATTASAPPAARHGKPAHSAGKAKGAGRSGRSEQDRENGNGRSHRPAKHAGGPDK